MQKMTGLDFMFIILIKNIRKINQDATIEELHQAKSSVTELIDSYAFL